MKVKRMPIFCWLLLVFSASLCAQDFYRIERDPRDLKTGMSFYEVLKLWGPPQEKREHEIKREDVWIYNNIEVFFKEGRVLAWAVRDVRGQFGEVINEEVKAEEAPPQESKTLIVRRPPQPGPEVAEILGEIMRETPTEGASPSGAAMIPPRAMEPFRPDGMPR